MSPIDFLIAKVRRWFFVMKSIPRLSVVVFRFANGRWFIFRDQPDWFVEMMAAEKKGKSKEFEGMLELAREEWNKRLNDKQKEQK